MPRSEPGGWRAAKRTVSRFVTNRLVNPVVRPLVKRGVLPSRQTAILETTGRRSGRPRQTPVGNGLRGEQFWIVTEHGWSAMYVKNIQAAPRVRVYAEGRWRPGTAEILPDDDPIARLRWLRRPGNDTMLRFVGTEQLTIRVDLDPEP